MFLKWQVARPSDYATRIASLATPYDCTDIYAAPGSYLEDTMWSPRRAHTSVVLKDNSILVMGGRAREHRRMPMDRNVGGITTRPMQNDKFYSAWREASVLKNDVWSSTDEGGSWTLLNPGDHRRGR